MLSFYFCCFITRGLFLKSNHLKGQPCVVIDSVFLTDEVSIKEQELALSLYCNTMLA